MPRPRRFQPQPSSPVLSRCIVLVVALLTPGLAYAQSTTNVAEALFEQGREAMDRGDYAAACPKFRESDRLDPALGTELNLANCEEQRGHFASAWLLYRQVRDRLPVDDRRIPVAEQRLAALEPRVPKLRLIVTDDAPRGIRVRIGERAIPSDRFGTAVPMDPGEWVVTVSIPGRPDQKAAVNLEEGETFELKVPFAAAQPVPAPATTDSKPNAPPGSGLTPQDTDDRILGLDRRTASYVAGGLGITGLLVGTIAGIAGLNEEATGDANCSDVTRTCNQTGFNANASARSLATVSTLGFVLGVAGAGTGAYLFFTAGPPHQRAPEGQARGASVVVGATW